MNNTYNPPLTFANRLEKKKLTQSHECHQGIENQKTWSCGRRGPLGRGSLSAVMITDEGTNWKLSEDGSRPGVGADLGFEGGIEGAGMKDSRGQRLRQGPGSRGDEVPGAVQ